MQEQRMSEINPQSFDKTSGFTIPVWYRECDSIGEFPLVTEPLQADVIVAGGGIAGLTTAYLLAKSGKSVILLEARELASGETGRTTAHLMSAVDDRYCEIERKHGKDVSRIVAESSCSAINLIESIVKEEQIQCDFERLDGYLFNEPSQTSDVISREFPSAREAGMKVSMESVPFPQGAPRTDGIKFSDQGQFHINKYMKGLAEACVKRGVKIFTKSPASLPPMEEDDGVYVTAHGNKISAKKIVVCINYYWHIFKMEAWRTYAIASKIPKGSVPKALYWNTEDPYVYARTTAGTDDSHDFLIVGGEDHRVGQYTNYDERYNNLIKWSKEKFPVSQEVVNKWSGQVTEPVDDLPFLGKKPGFNHVLLITGDSGTGMTNATIGAMICSDSIVGKENRWADVYNPGRQMTHDLAEFVKNGMEVSASYKNWVTPGEISDIEDLKNGCGGILRNGLTKVACFRDQQGQLHARSAVCTHYDAMLMWNEGEKSFDCPAHGSRFDPYGKPIMSPSCKELSTVDPATLKSQ